MVRFTPSPVHDGLHLTAQMAVAHMFVLLISPHKTHQRSLGHTFYRANCARRDQQMASGFFSREVQLRWVGPQMTRR